VSGGAEDGGDDDGAATDLGTPVSVGTGSVIADATVTARGGTTDRQPSSIEGVPGLTADGIVDLNALAAAHERAVANGSYTVWADTYRPPANVTDAGRVQEDVDVRVDGDRFSVVTSVEATRNGDRSVVRRVYGEGDARYVADATGGNVTYRRVGPDRAAPSVGPTPDYFASTAVLRYLSTPESTVTGRTEFDGRPAYRVAGRGRPSGLGFEGLVSYSVTAVVSSDGLVYDLTAQYSVVRDARRYDVQFEWTYDRLGETTVERPAWVDREFDDVDSAGAGNATATAAVTAPTPPSAVEGGGDGRGSE
jgi:hypothetical protein